MHILLYCTIVAIKVKYLVLLFGSNITTILNSLSKVSNLFFRVLVLMIIGECSNKPTSEEIGERTCLSFGPNHKSNAV